jgi:hypothetical protein
MTQATTTSVDILTFTGVPLYTRLARPEGNQASSDHGKYICRLSVPPTDENLANKAKLQQYNDKSIVNTKDDGSFEIKGKLNATGVRSDGTTFNKGPKVFLNGEQLTQEQIPMLESGHGTVTMMLVPYASTKKAGLWGFNLDSVYLHDDISVYEGTSGGNTIEAQLAAARQEVMNRVRGS